MEKTQLVLCDSDVLIELFDRNNEKAIIKLNALGPGNLCISSVSYSEILFGSRDKIHHRKLVRSLDKFLLIPISTRIDNLHRKLIREYSLSHKLHVQDALVAATALTLDIPLFTFNKRDFDFIAGLILVK